MAVSFVVLIWCVDDISGFFIMSPPLFSGINLVVPAYSAFGMLPILFCYIIANDVHLYLKGSYSAIFL